MHIEDMTTEQWELSVGENLKQLRLLRNIDQRTLAMRAGISTRALQRLENGEGSTLFTLIRVVRSLDRESWLFTIAPIASINPLTAVRHCKRRQRARSGRDK